jgi:hypothetical protein
MDGDRCWSDKFTLELLTMDSDGSFLLIPFATIVLVFNGSGIKVTKQMTHILLKNEQ